MRTIRIKLYKFDELSEAAKKLAINDHANFMSNMPEEFENEEGEMEEEYVDYTDNDADVIDNIKANEYIFFQDGKLAHCTTYTGKHIKAGKTEFHFHGKTYDITGA